MSSFEGLRDLVLREIESAGVTQAEVARSARISEKHLSRFLCGHDGMSLYAVDQVLDACDRRLVLGTVPAGDRSSQTEEERRPR